MSRILIFLWLTIGLFAVRTDGGEPCVVHLLNGDRLQGEYLGQDRSYLLLNSPRNPAVIRIHGKYVKTLDFGPREPAAPGGEVFSLASGERFRGRLLDYRDGKMMVETFWAGKQVLDSGYVQRVDKALPEDQILFEVSRDAGDWTYTPFGQSQQVPVRIADEFFLNPVHSSPVSQPNSPPGSSAVPSAGWLLRKEGNYTQSFPAVTGGLGIRMTVDFPELEPNSAVSILIMGLPGENPNRGPLTQGLLIEASFRDLVVKKSPMVTRRAFAMVQNSHLLGVLNEPATGVRELKFDFDALNGRFRVEVNGALLAEWEDADVKGTEKESYQPVILVSQRRVKEPLHISELMIHRREQALPEKSGEIPREAELILFKNGDFLQGEWRGLDQEGNWLLRIRESGEQVEVHPGRIEAWLSPQSSRKRMRRLAGHVEVKFPGSREKMVAELLASDGDSFTLRREGWEDEFQVPLSLVERVNFNPYYEDGR